MRKLIAAFKTSVDGKIEGPAGIADWVEAWSEDYGLSSQIDACLLGGTMYPGYEAYWSAMQRNGPGQPLPMTGKLPAPAELEWARLSARLPHYVVSNTLTTAQWPGTRFVRKLDDVADLKRQPGKSIYLMGGARLATSLLDAGLVDELRLIVYPLIAGEGMPLFAASKVRRALELRNHQALDGGRLALIYTLR